MPDTEGRTPQSGREEFTDDLEAAREKAEEIPTTPGSVFRISDFGFEDGGWAIAAIKRAFYDCWGGLALCVPGGYDSVRTYAFQGGSPLEISHIPDENHDPDLHGPQVMGIRYSYQFMADIEEDEPIKVLRWEDTHGPDVEEVVYP